MLIHGTVLGAADGIGFSLIGDGFAASSEKKPKVELVDLETTCRGDVLLATAARAAACLAPWQRDTEQCAQDLELIYRMDLSSCISRETLEPVAMTTVPTREIEKLVAIDPEPLLEELREPQKPPPPPPELKGPAEHAAASTAARATAAAAQAEAGRRDGEAEHRAGAR